MGPRGPFLLRTKLQRKGVHWLMVTWVVAGQPAQRQLRVNHSASGPSTVISERAQHETRGIFEIGRKLSIDEKSKL